LGRIEFLAWALLTVTASAQAPRQEDAPSHLRPAPQITGSLIDSDGKHRLSLQYRRNSIRQLFTGAIQSTCMLPSKSGESKPLDLSVIPFGTRTTVFYIRHMVGKQSQNVILALRFDRVRSGSTLPQGVVIPCVKSRGETAKPIGR